MDSVAQKLAQTTLDGAVPGFHFRFPEVPVVLYVLGSASGVN